MENKITSIAATVTPPGTNVHLPRLGFGVYQIFGESCISSCKTALDAGYRLIDSAQLYRNEDQVGAVVRDSELDRAEIFVTTKQGIRGATPQETYNLAAESVKRIAGSGPGAYVDLFLIHIPYVKGEAEGRKEVWQALERLYDEGKTRLIGVSNYDIEHIEEMKAYAKVWPPHVNQIELHPWRQQSGLVAYCENNGIVVQAYSPLAEGTKMDDPVVQRVAAKHDKSSAQVLIRYGLQKGWVVLPKSATPKRIKANANVFDFELDEEDMVALGGLSEEVPPS
ncbi:putative aldo-keto reductase [Podospora didyma]|uniref:Aldo-keto reductase n=1 Tax=Podospora didyma TaxID=330526 RepID=A0AAE0NPI3_9PEZI|nr:putative aldo-keto reductase [Podospora didyma]